MLQKIADTTRLIYSVIICKIPLKIGTFDIQTCLQELNTWDRKFELLSSENSDAFAVDSENGELFLRRNVEISSFLGTVMLTTEKNGMILPPKFSNFVFRELMICMNLGTK